MPGTRHAKSGEHQIIYIFTKFPPNASAMTFNLQITHVTPLISFGLATATLLIPVLAAFGLQGRSIIPEFQIAVHLPMFYRLSLILQYAFQCCFLVIEDSQMITHHMSVLTRRALDQHRATVIALFRHAVCGPITTWLASEGDLIGFFLAATLFVSALALGVSFWLTGVGGKRVGCGVVADGRWNNEACLTKK